MTTYLQKLPELFRRTACGLQSNRRRYARPLIKEALTRYKITIIIKRHRFKAKTTSNENKAHASTCPHARGIIQNPRCRRTRHATRVVVRLTVRPAVERYLPGARRPKIGAQPFGDIRHRLIAITRAVHRIYREESERLTLLAIV
ncbi:hypothetical protein [Paraburkholderia unamae]|uniref:hypothetical protein n=1 Tax=Paraburkholderia unamae TaxID=219649 RepID=UPI001FCBEE64